MNRLWFQPADNMNTGRMRGFAMAEQKSKTYVLDTNVLIQAPHALLSFEDNLDCFACSGPGRTGSIEKRRG